MMQDSYKHNLDWNLCLHDVFSDSTISVSVLCNCSLFGLQGESPLIVEMCFCVKMTDVG